MNFMTADIVLDVHLTKVSSDLKKAEAAANRAAAAVERNAQKTMRAVEKAHVSMAKAADKAAASAVKAHNAMVRKVEKAFTRMGRHIQNVYSTATRYAKYAAAAILGIGLASTKMAMDAEESENLYEMSMGKMADSTRAWSEELSEALYINSYEIRKNVGTLNVMLNSMGLSAEAAQEMSQRMTELTYDMASFYNLKTEDAYQKIQSGLTGQIKPLKTLGILIDVATIKQYALNNAIWDGVGEMTQQEKVMARYGAILEQTAKAQGDMERTLDSTTNVFRSLWSIIQETAIGLGNKLLPIATAVGVKMRNWLGTNQDKVIEFAVRGIQKLVEALRFVINEVRLMPAYWKAVQVAIYKTAVAVFALADASTNLDELFAWMRGDNKTYSKMADKFADKVVKLETEIAKLSQEFAEGSVAIDSFFDAIVDGLNKTPKKIEVVVPQTPGVFGGGAVEQIFSKPGGGMGDFEPSAPGGGSMADMEAMQNRNQLIIDMATEREDELAEMTTEHLSLLREQENMSLEAKIENIQIAMDAVREQYGVESDIYQKLAKEQANYQKMNIKGYDAMKVAMKSWAMDTMNWGKKVGNILTSAFSGFGDCIADVLVDGTADFKEFATSLIKQLVSMIVKMMIAAALMSIIFPSKAAQGAGFFSDFMANLKGGLVPGKATGGYIEKTGLYQMHQGEKVVTRSEAAAPQQPMTVNIVDNAGGLSITTEEDVKERVLNIIIEATETDGPLRAALQLA